jgi:hypothetical protein
MKDVEAAPGLIMQWDGGNPPGWTHEGAIAGGGGEASGVAGPVD